MRLLSFLSLAVVLSSCISYRFAEKDVFYPRKVGTLSPHLQFEEVYFLSEDSVRLSAWFIKHPYPQGTLLYFGGNGFSLWNRSTFDAINILSTLKVNLLLIDYRGYGRSEGTPTLQGTYDDGRSAYRYICSRPDVDSARIVVYGHSLGSFVATRLATSFPVAGIILEGAITNTSEMKDVVLKTNVPWYLRWLVKIDVDSSVLHMDNLSQARGLLQPLLVITGANDNISPPEMGRRIYNAASSRHKQFEVIQKADHNDLYFTADGRRDQFLAILSKFLNDILQPRNHGNQNGS